MCGSLGVSSVLQLPKGNSTGAGLDAACASIRGTCMRVLRGLATAADVFTWGRESCLACVVQCHCLQACREYVPCLLTV